MTYCVPLLYARRGNISVISSIKNIFPQTLQCQVLLNYWNILIKFVLNNSSLNLCFIWPHQSLLTIHVKNGNRASSLCKFMFQYFFSHDIHKELLKVNSLLKMFTTHLFILYHLFKTFNIQNIFLVIDQWRFIYTVILCSVITWQ